MAIVWSIDVRICIKVRSVICDKNKTRRQLQVRVKEITRKVPAFGQIHNPATNNKSTSVWVLCAHFYCDMCKLIIVVSLLVWRNKRSYKYVKSKSRRDETKAWKFKNSKQALPGYYDRRQQNQKEEKMHCYSQTRTIHYDRELTTVHRSLGYHRQVCVAWRRTIAVIGPYGTC